MKLLLDENLSRHLVPSLQEEFPGSTHVCLVGLQSAADIEIWEYARLNGLVVVTLDADFEELSVLRGAPPAVVWLKGTKLSRIDVLRLLVDNARLIREQIAAGTACVEIIKRS